MVKVPIYPNSQGMTHADVTGRLTLYPGTPKSTTVNGVYPD